MIVASAKEVFFVILKLREMLGEGASGSGDTGRLQLGYDECRALDGGNWMRAGVAANIPIGVDYETHHSECYRVYNASRERRRVIRNSP